MEENHRKIEKLVPRKFLKWQRVFGKIESGRIPTRKTWDHTIDLKKTFKLQKGRIYPLSKDEKEKVQKFMDDQLRKGYIRPSKSPQTLLVFFVEKKDKSKRMVMDYCSLNNQTIVMLQANFLWKITFDTLYTNRFLIRVCSRTLFISSECDTI